MWLIGLTFPESAGQVREGCNPKILLQQQVKHVPSIDQYAMCLVARQ
jgi:hypothetical protein